MYERAKTFTLTHPRVKKTVGWIFVVVGVVALVAPVVPGAPLMFVGFELLGFRLLFVDKLLRRKQPVLPTE
jgi:hypothetical protein